MNNTIDVELDRWSLKEGHDVHEYMESMVKADDIFRVLIICDRNYKEKADNRNGGVGTETQIITPAIYADQKQEKFIPLVVERDEAGVPYIPIYLGSRKYIDFSNNEYFESSYEDLLRNILEAPSIPKPKLGSAIPSYITESPTNNIITNSVVRSLESRIEKYPHKVDNIFSEFISNYFVALEDFEFKPVNREIISYGDELLNNLASYRILRDDFIDCVLLVTRSEYTLDASIIIEFFEKWAQMLELNSKTDNWQPQNKDNLKIILHELFLYVVAICLKKQKFFLIGRINAFKVLLPSAYGVNKPVRFTFIYKWHENLENYHQRKNNRIAGFGNYVVSSVNKKVGKETIILADTICYYVGDIFNPGDFMDNWFPTTYIYKDYYSSFEFYDKFSSIKHIEKVKVIFDVNTKEELKELFLKYKESKKDSKKDSYGRGSRDSIPFLFELVDIDNIGVNR